MYKRQLEEVVLSFFAGEVSVLVCTSIIESGLDVSNANTIIINDAHMFGLSQLYQIRGRVGRGVRQAFCYLLIPPIERLTNDAVERLKALEASAELGSGYNIALKDLEIVMQKKFAANTSLRASQVGGVKAAAQIMNFMKGEDEQKIFKEVAKFSKNLMTDIQEAMFVFDNLIKSDDKSMQVIIRSVETEDLVLAMKGADEELQEKMFSCMSQRAAANVQDEMDALGPVRLSEVQEAQKRIINTARRLSDEGTIVLAGRGGDDYV